MHTQADNPITPAFLSQLSAAAGTGPVLILTHDNPDPDSLASGKGLAALLRAWGLSTRLVYSGLVARAENRTVLNRLTPEWEHSDTLDTLDGYSAVALVDTQPTAGNNRVPATCTPRIVFDHHHPVREAIAHVDYVDIRPEIGSTVTLVYQHLEAAGVEIDPILATAMFYGLKTDTQGLSRGASLADEVAYLELLALADRAEIIQVEQSGLQRNYFRAFSRGLNAARVHGSVVIAELGALERPDLPAELADLLLRLEGTRAALCLGVHRGTLQLSLRLKMLDHDAGLLIQHIVVPPGKAGGHGNIAGGQVPIQGEDAAGVSNAIKQRFLAIMGETGPGEPLI